MTLHLTESDEYENRELSVLYPKVKAALKWATENKEFDYVFLGDDDIYINVKEFLKLNFTHDYTGTGSMGGGGFIFNKKAVQSVLKYENTKFRVCDQAIYNAIVEDESITKIFENPKASVYYIPGELYATIHYVTGKRSYFLHNTFRHFQENGYTNRKIILGFPLESQKSYELISYESTAKRKTRRWYDYTVDPNGWEYHGGYLRSSAIFNHFKTFWPYAKNGTKFFVLNYNVILHDYVGYSNFQENLQYLIDMCEDSLIDKRNLILCSEKMETVKGWEIDNSVREKLNLNYEGLNNYNFYKKINNE